MCGGAEVQGGIDPSIHFRPAPGLVDGRHQRIAVCVRLSNHRRTSIRPIRIGEGRRIQRRRNAAPRRSRRRCNRSRSEPVLPVRLRPAGKEALPLDRRLLRSIRQRFINLLCRSQGTRQDWHEHKEVRMATGIALRAHNVGCIGPRPPSKSSRRAGWNRRKLHSLKETTRKDWRRGSESNRRIKVLQTSPLPLGYRAPAPTLAFRPEKVHWRRQDGKQRNLERETGVEPATSTLARSRSTTELLPLKPQFYSTRVLADNS